VTAKDKGETENREKRGEMGVRKEKILEVYKNFKTAAARPKN
jgi:hypothetical protein